MVPGGEGQEPWVPIAKAQLKKQTKMFQAEKRKRESAAKQARGLNIFSFSSTLRLGSWNLTLVVFQATIIRYLTMCI